MALNKAVLALSLVMAVFVVGTITTSVLQLLAGNDTALASGSASDSDSGTTTISTTTPDESLLVIAKDSRRFDESVGLLPDVMLIEDLSTLSATKNVSTKMVQNATSVPVIDDRLLDASIKLISDLAKQVTTVTKAPEAMEKTADRVTATPNATDAVGAEWHSVTATPTRAEQEPYPVARLTPTPTVEERKWQPVISVTSTPEVVLAKWHPVLDNRYFSRTRTTTTETEPTETLPDDSYSLGKPTRIKLLSDVVSRMTAALTRTTKVVPATWRPIDIYYTPDATAGGTAKMAEPDATIMYATDSLADLIIRTTETETEASDITTPDSARKQLEEWIAMVAKRLPELNFTTPER